MDTVTVKTCELIGPALDWAVAKCEDAGIYIKDGMLLISGVTWGYYKPSTDWGQGGPIIEREFIHIGNPMRWTGEWRSQKTPEVGYMEGPTPLIAAMRCYVTSKLGGTVQIPKELSL